MSEAGKSHDAVLRLYRREMQHRRRLRRLKRRSRNDGCFDSKS
jgi:hypothetical protein